MQTWGVGEKKLLKREITCRWTEFYSSLFWGIADLKKKNTE